MRDYSSLDMSTERVSNAIFDAITEKGAGYIYPRQPKPRPVTEADNAKPYFPGSAPWGTTCLYVHKEGEQEVPGCIVGQVLVRLGVSLEDLKEVEGDNATAAMRRLHVPAGQFGPLLHNMQREQDDGSTWGHALVEAAQESAIPEGLLERLGL